MCLADGDKDAVACTECNDIAIKIDLASPIENIGDMSFGTPVQLDKLLVKFCHPQLSAIPLIGFKSNADSGYFPRD